jgi:hypothetical protein
MTGCDITVVEVVVVVEAMVATGLEKIRRNEVLSLTDATKTSRVPDSWLYHSHQSFKNCTCCKIDATCAKENAKKSELKNPGKCS